jgi:hypothetical protein
MIEAVLVFGLMNVLFEFVLLSMLPPRRRLRLLGSPTAKALAHISFLVINLIIHFGTIIGTMSAILAFISSIATVHLSEMLFGYITEDRYYHVGWIKYSVGELR